MFSIIIKVYKYCQKEGKIYAGRRGPFAPRDVRKMGFSLYLHIPNIFKIVLHHYHRLPKRGENQCGTAGALSRRARHSKNGIKKNCAKTRPPPSLSHAGVRGPLCVQLRRHGAPAVLRVVHAHRFLHVPRRAEPARVLPHVVRALHRRRRGPGEVLSRRADFWTHRGACQSAPAGQWGNDAVAFLTERFKICLVSWNPADGSIITHDMGDARMRIGRETQCGLRQLFDPAGRDARAARL